MSILRGIQARTLLAMARVRLVVGIIDEVGGNDADAYTQEAIMIANQEGYFDAETSISDMPAAFRDEACLANAWREGRDFYFDCQATEECPECQCHSILVCSVHG